MLRVQRRGVSAMSYGLLVGLIAVVGLAAITRIGTTQNVLFGTVATRLSNLQPVAPPAATATPSGGPCGVTNSCLFVSSSAYTGNMGGLTGADTLCTNDPANTTGRQARALLATNYSNHDRGLTFRYPVLRLADQQTVATNATQFLCHQESCGDWAVQAFPGTLPASVQVWTGVRWLYQNGSTWSTAEARGHCSGWTSNSGTANWGYNTSTNKPILWNSGSGGGDACSENKTIFCIVP